MWPDRVLNPGPLNYKSGALPTALRGPASPKKHFCEIILKTKNWTMRRCHFKTISILSSGSHFIQQSSTILALLVKGHQRKISVKLI